MPMRAPNVDEPAAAARKRKTARSQA